MAKWQYRGRWALVTGASSGIGEVFARELAARGMHLVLAARREERLRALAAELHATHGIESAVIPIDLAEPGAATRLWERAARGRAIHLLINNAGFGAQGRFNEIPLERQTAMVHLNCTAVMELAHLALPAMRERGEGGIINVASGAAFQPIPLLATYAASKAFVLSLSESLWAENRKRGVHVLALCPGTTPTGFQREAGISRTEGAPGVTSAGEVVDAALKALERKRSVVVPGAVNRIAVTLTRLLPLPLATRLAGAAMERIHEAGERRRGKSA